MRAHPPRVAIRLDYILRSPGSVRWVDGFEWRTVRAPQFRDLERGRAVRRPGHFRRFAANLVLFEVAIPDCKMPIDDHRFLTDNG